MIRTADNFEAIPIWEDTLPHFSVTEKGDRITAMPLDGPAFPGFMSVVTCVSWAPFSAGVALFVHNVTSGDRTPNWWIGLIVLYSFLLARLTDITVDEARDRFGRRSTAKLIAAIPMFAGLAVGLLLAWLWADDLRHGWITASAVGCLIGAALALLASWWSLRHTRKRQEWITLLRHTGTRTSGRLREVTFLRQWADSKPLFRVVVTYHGASGPQAVTANMITTRFRVPRPDAPVVVTYSPHDPTAEPLIELDHTRDPAFDPDHEKYSKPSGN